MNAPAPHLLTKLNPERMFLLGDPRTNQNPAFLVMGILFYRWHNYQVSQVTFIWGSKVATQRLIRDIEPAGAGYALDI